MKNLILTILTCLVTLVAKAQDNPAYRIFTSDGEKTDYSTMIETVSKADVIFVGETHNCPIAHWMEYEIISDIARKCPKGLVLGAEMFESDNQLLLDEYVSGLISSDRFESEAKLWDNHYTDYAPLLYLASIIMPLVGLLRRVAASIFLEAAIICETIELSVSFDQRLGSCFTSTGVLILLCGVMHFLVICKCGNRLRVCNGSFQLLGKVLR